MQFPELACGELSYKLSSTSQDVTWKMNQLKKEDIIQENKEAAKVIFALEELLPVVAK